MRAQLVGSLPLDFVSNDNKHVQGTQLHIVYADPTSDVVGSVADKVFVKKEIPLPVLKPGDFLEITYNHKGKVMAVSVATSSKT